MRVANPAKGTARGRRPARAALLVLTLLVVGLTGATSAQAAPTWLSPTTRASTSSSQADAAIDNRGNVLVVWTQSNGANNVIKASFRPTGGSYGTPLTLSAAGQNADSPHVEFDGAGNAFVVWHRFNGTNNVVQLRRKPAGGSFGAVEDLTASSVNSTYPQIDASSNGTAVVAWLTGGVVQALVRSPSGSYGPTTPLSAAGVNVSLPTPPVDVAMNDAGDALISWTRGSNLAESVYRPRGGSFEPVQTATAPSGSTSVYPKAAIDRFGNATLVFETCSPCTIFSVFRPAGSSQPFEGVQTMSSTPAAHSCLKSPSTTRAPRSSCGLRVTARTTSCSSASARSTPRSGRRRTCRHRARRRRTRRCSSTLRATRSRCGTVSRAPASSSSPPAGRRTATSAP